MSPLIVALHVVICSQFNGTALSCMDRKILDNSVSENSFFTYTYCVQHSQAIVAKYKTEELPDGWKVQRIRCTMTNRPSEIPI